MLKLDETLHVQLYNYNGYYLTKLENKIYIYLYSREN